MEIFFCEELIKIEMVGQLIFPPRLPFLIDSIHGFFVGQFHDLIEF